MRYISKNQYYESPSPTQGLFENAFVKTGDRKISPEKETFSVDFELRYTKDDKEIVLERKTETFAEHQPTIILNENDEEEEIQEFLARGGTYQKDRIARWGRPSFERIQDYFDATSVWGELRITENEPYRTIAKDWIDENVRIQGRLISESFEMEV